MKRETIFLVSLLLAVPSAHASEVAERGFGGALGGAIFGSLVGGKKGARKGAMIGGAIGVARGADERARRQERERALQRQEEERRRMREARMQREIDELRHQRRATEALPTTGGRAGSGGAATNSVLIIETQKSLIRLGYNPGGVDGQLGPQTINAIRQYQGRMGLLETGDPSQALLSHMLTNGG